MTWTPDSLSAKLIGRGPSESDDSTLGRGIVEQIWLADVVGYAVAIDGQSLLLACELARGFVRLAAAIRRQKFAVHRMRVRE